MFEDVKVGSLHEPVSGRRREPSEIERSRLERAFHRNAGLRPGDREGGPGADA